MGVWDQPLVSVIFTYKRTSLVRSLLFLLLPALLVSARLHGFCRTVREVVKTVRISDTTIRKRLGDFRETPSSQLTIDEFQTIDLEEEQDPPSFTAARRRAKQQLEELSKPEITSELQAFQNAINRALGVDPSTDLTTNALESTPVVVSENVTVNTTDEAPKDGTSTFVPPLCKGNERSIEKEGRYACLLLIILWSYLVAIG